MQDLLLVFKPVTIMRTNSIYLTEKKRKHSVFLDSNSFSERVTFRLPAVFVVDEMQDAINLEATFGKYSTKYEVKDNKLYFTRSLLIN